MRPYTLPSGKYSLLLLLLLSLISCDISLLDTNRVHRIELRIPVMQLALQETVQAGAALFSSEGRELTSKPVVWSSSAPLVVQVDAEGRVTAISPGHAIITVQAEGRDDSVRIEALNQSTQEARYGPTVTDAVRAHVKAVGSAIDPVGTEKDMLVRIPHDSPEWLVLAVNDTGDPLLSAIASPGHVVTLDAASTAISAVRTSLLLLPIPASRLNTLQDEIRHHPGFTMLADSIRELSEKGVSYTNSDATIQQIAYIAAAVGQNITHPPVAQITGEYWTNTATARTASFSRLPITLEDKASSTDITAVNRSFIPIAIKVMNKPGQPLGPIAVLNGRDFVLWPLPSFGDHVRKDIPAANGELRVWAGQTDETRRIRMLSLVSDTLLGIYTIIGIPLAKNDVAALVWDIHTSILTPQQLVDIANEPAEQALSLTADIILSARELIINATYAMALKKYGRSYVNKFITRAALKQFLKTLAIAEIVALVLERAPYYYHWNQYASIEEEVPLCQVNGFFCKIYSGSVIAVGSSTHIASGCSWNSTWQLTVELVVGDTGSGRLSGSHQQVSVAGCGTDSNESTGFLMPLHANGGTVSGFSDGANGCFNASLTGEVSESAVSGRLLIEVDRNDCPSYTGSASATFTLTAR